MRCFGAGGRWCARCAVARDQASMMEPYTRDHFERGDREAGDRHVSRQRRVGRAVWNAGPVLELVPRGLLSMFCRERGKTARV